MCGRGGHAHCLLEAVAQTVDDEGGAVLRPPPYQGRPDHDGHVDHHLVVTMTDTSTTTSSSAPARGSARPSRCWSTGRAPDSTVAAAPRAHPRAGGPAAPPSTTPSAATATATAPPQQPGD